MDAGNRKEFWIVREEEEEDAWVLRLQVGRDREMIVAIVMERKARMAI